jgi:hypothetical protein
VGPLGNTWIYFGSPSHLVLTEPGHLEHWEDQGSMCWGPALPPYRTTPTQGSEGWGAGGGDQRALTLLGRGQHNFQPILQCVVTVDGWGVRHDGDPGLVGCVEPFHIDVCFQGQDVACLRSTHYEKITHLLLTFEKFRKAEQRGKYLHSFFHFCLCIFYSGHYAASIIFKCFFFQHYDISPIFYTFF